MTKAVRQFLGQLASAVAELKAAGEDTGRLLTIFNVKLESVKKIGDADVMVGVKKAEGDEGPLTVVRTQDPNITHPLRQREVLEEIRTLHDQRFTSYIFQAIVWRYDLKKNPQYCWAAKEGVLTKYSNDIVMFIRRITAADLKTTVTDYREYLRNKTQIKIREAGKT